MYEEIICAACDEFELPEILDNCIPEQNESEIAYIFVAKPSAVDPDVSAVTAPDWTSQTAVATAYAGTNGFMLRVIGDMPEPETAQRVVSAGRIARDKKTFVVNITVDDTNDTNYEATRALECNPELFLHYMTKGGKVYGGDTGIKVQVSKSNAPLDRGDGTYERFEWAFTWKHKNHPPRENGWLYQGEIIPIP